MEKVDKRTDEMKEMDKITDHLISLIESKDERYSFEISIRGKIWIRDKEKNCAYAITINKLENEEERTNDITNMVF